MTGLPSQLDGALVVGDMIEPRHDLALRICLLDGDVRHEAVRSCAVPVLLTRLDVDGVTRTDFLQLWAAHDVRRYRSGSMTIIHPVVGELELNYEAILLTADSGLTLNAFSAALDSAAADALKLLASWTSSSGALATETKLTVERPTP